MGLELTVSYPDMSYYIPLATNLAQIAPLLLLFADAWGGNHFIIGGSVAGGKILGTYPDDFSDTGPLNIGRGRLIPTMPWEGLWLGVAEWFGVEPEQIETVLPNLGAFTQNIYGKSDLYTVA